MSTEAVEWVVQLPITSCSATAFRVLVVLAERADNLGRGAWASKPKVAGFLHCHERTVQRAFRELQDRGLIRLGDQNHPNMRMRGGNRPTVYDVLTPALVYIEARGGKDVHPRESGGDISGHRGETTGVHRTTHEPTYQDSQHHLTYSNARESAMSR